jgi:hypothetical protein
MEKGADGRFNIFSSEKIVWVVRELIVMAFT